MHTSSLFLNSGKEGDIATKKNHNKNKKYSESVINTNIPEYSANGTSKMLINQILGENNIDRDAQFNLNEPFTDQVNLHQVETTFNYEQNFVKYNVKSKYSIPTFNYKSFSTQYGSYSEDSVVPNKIVDKSLQGKATAASKNNIQETEYAEKTTYCRTARNYNLEFINKTVEKNYKLEKLVKKLIDVRKEEKQIEAWNNYINKLKNKHRYDDIELNKGMNEYSLAELIPLEYIDDYNTHSLRPPNQSRNLLHNFHEANNTFMYQEDYRSQRITSPHNYYPNCYPISSQGRLMMLNREENKHNTHKFGKEIEDRSKSRHFYGNTIYVDIEPTRLRSTYHKVRPTKTQNINLPKKYTHERISSKLTNASVQTENSPKQLLYHGNEEEDMTLEYSRISQNVEKIKDRLKNTCHVNASKTQDNLFQSMETKLDSLLDLINSFIDEVKSKTYISKHFDSPPVCKKSLNNKHITQFTMPVSKNDTVGLIKTESLACGLKELKPVARSHETMEGKSNSEKILPEDIKSSKIDDEKKLSNANVVNYSNNKGSMAVANCSVQISYDIPTKERSTEVTDSLAKGVFILEDKSKSIEEIVKISSGSDRNMTIAVNTDPLGLLALLRVSAETVKQILSYVPNISVADYLSLYFPQRTAVSHSHYVCNICGAAFARPSQLSDHIRSHNLGLTRDCCVCRHVLDIQNYRFQKLFRCQYCGQRFTRAYCCELHQESCAKRLGRTHDVTRSLVLLK